MFAVVVDDRMSGQSAAEQEESRPRPTEPTRMESTEVRLGIRILWHLGISVGDPLNEYVHPEFKAQKDSGARKGKELVDV